MDIMKLRHQIAASGLGLFLLTQPLTAGALEEGATAVLRGDYATAIQLLEPLANGGNAPARFTLGFLYLNGYGVPKDLNKGLELYELSAAQGYAEAQYNLGVIYDNGSDVPRDYEEALKWYSLAATQGHAKAEYNLASLYLSGLGTEQNFPLGVKWLKLSALHGASAAQNHLGALYAEGKGVKQDFVIAHMWFNVAAQSSDGEIRDRAIKNRETVAKKMTAEDFAVAQQMARDWLTVHKKK